VEVVRVSPTRRRHVGGDALHRRRHCALQGVQSHCHFALTDQLRESVSLFLKRQYDRTLLLAGGTNL
jgi:hypothetical protein